MEIKEVLKKQGELYKNLPDNETIKEHNKKIEKPEPEEDLEEKLKDDLKKELDFLIKALPASVYLLGMGGFLIGTPIAKGIDTNSFAYEFYLICALYSVICFGIGAIYFYKGARSFKKYRNLLKNYKEEYGI